jgi:hypothetical protein
MIAKINEIKTAMSMEMAEYVHECTICLDKLEIETQVVPLACNKTHIFHEKCLMDWSKHNYTCPCCR